MAKSFNNQWRHMVNLDNIKAAIYAAAKGKRRKKSVRRALANIDETAAYIKALLESEKWEPPRVRQGYLYEDGIAKKPRIIVHPDFIEQVIHHLLIDYIIEPIFLPTFYRWSCGSIPGRGQEGMAKYIERMAKKHPAQFRHHVEVDIRKCFDTIDIESIYQAIKAKIRDRRVMRVVRLILEANELKLPDGSVRKGGVPIGLYTSPWFVNIVLSRVDHYIKDECAMFLLLRFIDDFEITGPNRRKIEQVLDVVEEILVSCGMELKKRGGSRPQIKSFKSDHGWKARFTGFHFDQTGNMQVRDKVFIRAQRLGARIRRVVTHRRLSAFVSSKMISYGGRFRAFGAYSAFPRFVLRGIRYFSLRQKIAARDKLRQYKEAA